MICSASRTVVSGVTEVIRLPLWERISATFFILQVFGDKSKKPLWVSYNFFVLCPFILISFICTSRKGKLDRPGHVLPFICIDYHAICGSNGPYYSFYFFCRPCAPPLRTLTGFPGWISPRDSPTTRSTACSGMKKGFYGSAPCPGSIGMMVI